MIVKLARRGTSFKGASAYYLHDKKQEGETSRFTSERVAWTATRNISTTNAQFAFRVMAATAMDKDRLKELAGVSKSGRKSKGDVYSYSVAWHPDEKGKFSKEDMLQAVDETLTAIGASDHQAVIIAHLDEPHPHAHVVLNLVNPHTGKSLDLHNDVKKLDSWAYGYRKARGEEEIYCPVREKKAKAKEARKNGQEVEYVKGSNNDYELNGDYAQLRDLNISQQEIRALKRSQSKLDKQLVSRSIDLNNRQAGEVTSLDTRFKEEKRKLQAEHRESKRIAREAAHEQMKPAFAELYRQQANERKMFDDREKRLSGKLTNAVEIVKRIHSIWGKEDKGFLSMAFGYFARQGRRSAWLSSKQNSEIRKLHTERNQQIRKAISELRKQYKARQASLREKYNIDYDAQNRRHKIELADLKQDWRLRKDEKKSAIEALKKKGRIKSTDGKHLEQSDVKRAKQDYVAARLEEKKSERASRKGRRSRTRKRT